MSIILNGGSNPTIVKYNNTDLQKVIYNNVTVWQKGAPVSNAYCTGGVHLVKKSGTQIWPYGPGAGSGDVTTSGPTRSTIPAGSCISWYSTYCRWKAEVACKVTIKGSLSLCGVDRGAQHDCFLYYNGSKLATLFSTYVSRLTSGTGNINYTFNMAAGKVAYIACAGGNDFQTDSARAAFSGTVYISASPT